MGKTIEKRRKKEEKCEIGCSLWDKIEREGKRRKTRERVFIMGKQLKEKEKRRENERTNKYSEEKKKGRKKRKKEEKRRQK